MKRTKKGDIKDINCYIALKSLKTCRNELKHWCVCNVPSIYTSKDCHKVHVAPKMVLLHILTVINIWFIHQNLSQMSKTRSNPCCMKNTKGARLKYNLCPFCLLFGSFSYPLSPQHVFALALGIRHNQKSTQNDTKGHEINIALKFPQNA